MMRSEEAADTRTIHEILPMHVKQKQKAQTKQEKIKKERRRLRI